MVAILLGCSKIGSATVSVRTKFLTLHELKNVISKQLTLKLEQAQRQSILVQRTEKTELNV